MDFEPSDKVKRLEARVRAFMEADIYPAEKIFERQMARGVRPLAGAADHGGAEGARRAPPGCGTCSCPRANTARA